MMLVLADNACISVYLNICQLSFNIHVCFLHSEVFDVFDNNYFCFKLHIQIPISYWLNDGYRFWNTTNFRDYRPLIGEVLGPFSTPLRTDFSKYTFSRIIKVMKLYLSKIFLLSRIIARWLPHIKSTLKQG